MAERKYAFKQKDYIVGLHADIKGELKKMKSAVHLVRQGDDWLQNQ